MAARPLFLPPSSLLPIRADVVSDDKTVHIVETLLMDPSCLPIPLYEPLHEAVERNVRRLSYTVLTDLETQGMGRSGKNFTGRVDLWTPSLQTKLENQLRPQLWYLALFGRSAPKHLLDMKMNEDDDDNTPQEALSSEKSSSKNPNAIPIRIRLNTHGISVNETILWDPFLSSYTPFDFARDLAEELNLTEEAQISIMTTMVEQLHGIEIDPAGHESMPPGARLLDQKDQISSIAQLIIAHKPK